MSMLAKPALHLCSKEEDGLCFSVFRRDIANEVSQAKAALSKVKCAEDDHHGAADPSVSLLHPTAMPEPHVLHALTEASGGRLAFLGHDDDIDVVGNANKLTVDASACSHQRDSSYSELYALTLQNVGGSDMVTAMSELASASRATKHVGSDVDSTSRANMLLAGKVDTARTCPPAAESSNSPVALTTQNVSMIGASALKKSMTSDTSTILETISLSSNDSDANIPLHFRNITGSTCSSAGGLRVLSTQLFDDEVSLRLPFSPGDNYDNVIFEEAAQVPNVKLKCWDMPECSVFDCRRRYKW